MLRCLIAGWWSTSNEGWHGSGLVGSGGCGHGGGGEEEKELIRKGDGRVVEQGGGVAEDREEGRVAYEKSSRPRGALRRRWG